MRLPGPIAVYVTCALSASVAVADVASCQSVLERPPNLSGGWLGARGTLQFNFVHRFGVGDAPLRKVTNSPTFLLAYQLPVPLLIGFNYATSSDIAAAFPNEWEVFARYGRSGVALQVGYNQAAGSADAELTGVRSVGRLRLMAVGRLLSNGYHTDTTRYAVGGGATLRLHRWVALAGDVTTLINKRASEKVAWGAGLQLAIPYSPHTLSLQVTNTNTATLQGASRKRIEIAPGTTVRWTNNDQLVHTITADDGSWDSGPIEPGKSWSHTFTKPGEVAFHCTPHPFMKAVIVVRQP